MSRKQQTKQQPGSIHNAFLFAEIIPISWKFATVKFAHLQLMRELAGNKYQDPAINSRDIHWTGWREVIPSI